MKKYNTSLFRLNQIVYISFLFFAFCFGSKNTNAQSTANYTFTTAATGSLVLDVNSNAIDMSTGTTQLVAASVDDSPASSLTNLNLGSGNVFDLWFMGSRYTQFGVTANGIITLGVIPGTSVYALPNSTVPTISPFANDMQMGSDGKIEAKVFGTFPNRVLVIQWTKVGIRYSVTTGTATFQTRLYESTGLVEFVYGTMTTNSSTPATYNVGFSVNTTVNNVITVNTTAHTASTSATVTANSYTASSTITSLNSAADGSRRYYRFTPPATLAAPTSLNFTAVGSTGMTLNWTASSPTTNILKYAIYNSTDNVTFNYVGTVNLGTNTYAATGLSNNTTYYWKVYSVSEGVLSTALTGIQATTATTTTTFSTAGATTWVAPCGVTSVIVETWGAGGGGGSSNNTTTNGGSGGGGGAYSKSTLTVTSGNTYYLNIGAGGAGGPASSTTAPTAGGDSWFNSVNSAPGSTAGVLAKGGGAGVNNSLATPTNGGASASGYGTTTKTSGSNGVAGTASGGGAGGAGANGGAGGAGSSSADGTIGTAPGGGGGGSDDTKPTKGGDGGVGQVVLQYIILSPTITLGANAPASANICASTLKVPLQSFSLAITNCTANLTNVGFTTTGTYVQADISKYQLWYSSTNSLSGATQVGTDLSSSGAAGARTFSAFTTPTLSSGTTYYFWITADIASSVTNDHTIAVNAIATTDLTSTSTKAGSSSAGGTQTLKSAPATPGAITSNSPQCAGTGITFTKGSCTEGTCYWVSSASGTETSNSAATFTSATTAGTYNVWVRAQNASGCWSTSVTSTGTINAFPSITAQPSASTQNICKNGTATALSVTVSPATGYQWYSNTSASNSGGTLISGATSSSYTPLTTAVGTLYYYCIIVNSGCSTTSSVSGGIVITALPTVTATPTSASMCLSGSPVSITASGATSYIWSPTTGLYTDAAGTIAYTGTNLATVYAKPASTSTYTVTGTTSGCTATATSAIAITAAPSAITITPSSANICAGAIQSLVTTGGTVGGTLLSEPFTGASLPSGWTAVIGSGDAIATANSSSAGGTAYEAKISGNSQSTDITDILYYGPINTTGSSTLTLQWNNYLDHYDSGYLYSVRVQTSTDGVTWHNSSWGTDPVTADISVGLQTTTISTADVGSPTFYLAFTMSGKTFGANYWYIDNVLLTGATGATTMTWSPTTGLYTDAGATVAYTGTSATTVYAKPASTTTYTASATSGGCSTTANATVTIAPISCGALTTGGATTCAGIQTVTAHPSGGGTPYSYAWKEDGVAIGGTTATIFPNSGTHTYACIVTDNCGSTCSSSLSVATSVAPTITSQPLADSTLVGTTTTFSITASGSPTYQWQYATSASGPWSNVANSTPANVTYTGGTTATLSVIVGSAATTGNTNYYQCIATTGSCSATSGNAQLTITNYCSSISTYATDEDIYNVTFGTLNNSSTCSTTGGAGSIQSKYSNYTGVAAPNVQQASTVAFSVQVGTCGGDYSNACAIWIDYNQDGDFADAGEDVYASPSSTSGAHTETGNITIPMTALTGNTRMRIICQETPVSSDPCETYEYGETEDYLINITLAPACSGTPTAGTTTATSTSVCSGTLSTISVTGATTGYSALTYQWQSSSDNSSWSNISAATGLTYAAYPTANTYYRRAITCSGSTAYSSSILVSVVTCFIMDNNPVTTCSGNFYDSGGASGNYSYSETFTKTFTSSTSGNALQFTFSAFTTESSLDYLYVYDGATTSSPQVAGSPFSGSSLPSVILSSGSSLTFKFTSDGSDQYAGWAASISCVPIAVPNCPTLSSPADAISTICPGSGATLTWTPAGTGFAATSYQLYFGTNNPPTNIINDINIGNVTSYATGPLASNTTYYWKIVPVNSLGGNSTCTTVYSFTTQNISISSTNSPVTTCLNTATLTATSGGTINWYDQPTGGTLLGTGGSLVRTFSGNATYYVGASNGSTSDQTTGLPGPNTSTMTSSSMGIRFTTIAALTLKTVDVYVTTAGTNLTVRLQNTSSTDLLTKTFTNMPAGKNTLTLNFAIPTAGNYILISEDGVSLGYHDAYSTYPITLAGVMSITSGEWWGVSTSSYGYFYNLTVSAGSTCESARMPVNIIHTASPITITPDGPTTFALGGSVGLTASSSASPAYTYTWTPSTGLNTTTGATVTATPSGTTTYTVVGTNGTPCTQTASVTVEVILPCSGLGSSGVTNISALPYSVSGQTTVGMGNEITSSTAIICGSSSYYTGNDVVYVFTPTVSGSSTITLTTITGTYTGLMLYDGCPMNGQGGACVSYSQSSTGNKSMCVSLNAGTTYYLVLDYYSASATIPSNYSFSITAPDPLSTPNDLPCNADVLNTGDLTPGENTCATGIDEPVAPSCWTNGTINTVWYKLTTGASQTSIKIKTVVGSLLNTQIALYSGTCGSGMSLIGCNDDVAACGSSYYKNSELTATVSPNTTYYVAVDGYSDLTGTFSIVWIDGAASWPPVPGQDCGTEVPVCSATFAIGNPGYQAVGNNCDFGTSYCLASGERGSAWYEVKINANGNLMFTIEPNDVTPAIGTAGNVTDDGTDYDWAVWKKTGTGAISCAQIAAGTATPLKCNYSGIGITGLYTGGVTPPSNTYTNHTYTSGAYDGAFEDPIPVLSGETYYIAISNFSNSLSGFTINFTNSSNGFDFSVPDPLVWTGGGASTNWFDSKNWGNCAVYPDDTRNCVIAASSSYQPIINASGAKCKSITINPGATLTINNGYNMDVYGNYNNQGSLVTNPTSSVTMVGSVAQTMDGIMVYPSEFNNLIINKTGNQVTLNQNLETSGNLTLSSSSYGLNGNNNTVSVAGNVSMANTTFTPGSTGTFTIIGNSTTHTIDAGNNTFSNFIMDQTGNITLSNNNVFLNSSGVLSLNNGIMNTGSYQVIVNNTNPIAVNDGNSTSYINGNIRRYLATNTGTYAFPVGTASAYRLAEIINNSMTGISYIDGKFSSTFTSTGSLNSSIAVDLGTPYTSFATEGIWTLTPNAQPSAGSYGINLWFDGGGVNAFSGLTDYSFGPLKRGNGSTTANLWSSQGGSISASIGRTVADGYAYRNGWSTFSEFVIGKAPGALPITLLNAQLKCNNNIKEISWSTASELNNDYFSILSSINAIDFVEKARIQGAGNSNTTKQYSWRDTTSESNQVMYYQLKQTDYNGVCTSLSLLSGNCNNTQDGDIIIISNPNNPNIEAQFVGDLSGKYNISVVNYLGQIVLQKEIDIDTDGRLVMLSKKGLASGLYNVVFKNKKGLITKQVLVSY
jgi:hypothetical protein